MSLFANTAAATAVVAKAIASNIYLAALGLTDPELAGAVYAAEGEVQRRLGVLLAPTEIFSGAPPTSDELTALGSTPWREEPAYDYDPEGFRGDRWGFISLRQPWVISIASVVFRYPGSTTTAWSVPSDWFKVDKKPGNLQLVPTGPNVAQAPFSTWVLQLMGGARVVPQMIHIRYRAGLTDALTDYPQLITAIRLLALSELAAGAMIPTSGSISADGLSESSGFDFGKLQDAAEVVLMGPKGSNGGLWAALRGVTVGFLA